MRKYRDYLIEKLSDRQETIAYLQTALEEYQTDGDTAAFLLAVRTVAEAQGGLQKIAKRSHIDVQELDAALSPYEKPQLDKLSTILNGLGYRLSIEPLEAPMSG